MRTFLERAGLHAVRVRELRELAPHCVLSRVCAVHRGQVDVLDEDGVRRVLGPRDAGRVLVDGDYPAVGDWVAIEHVSGVDRVALVLPRRTWLRRRDSGTRTAAQTLAVNVDIVFVVTSLGADLNARRVARYLALVHGSGAEAVVVLSKADLDPSAAADAVRVLEACAPGVPVVSTSAVAAPWVDAARAFLGPGCTVALIGSSGVGKSSLVNRLVGAPVMDTRAERAHDGRGKHTTTHRQMLLLPGDAGVLVDTPGLRELQLWNDAGFADAFADLEGLAVRCRYRDCQHGGEPGCAVRDAIDAGVVDADRLRQWRGLQREAAHQDLRVAEQRRRGQRKTRRDADTVRRWKRR